MSDIPTNATGVHVIGAHAYLYNRNGTYIADAALATGVLEAAHLDRNATDNRDAAAQWLDTIGYRIIGTEWTEHHGWLRAVEYIGAPAEPVAVGGPVRPPTSHHDRIAAVAAELGWTLESRGKWTSGPMTIYVHFDKGRRILTAAAYNGPREENRCAQIIANDVRKMDQVLRWFSKYADRHAVTPDPEEPANVDLHAPSAGPA